MPHFGIDPLFFGLLVALNLQTAFLSPPVAMAAFYLKGVSPPHVTLNQIFAGMMPFMGIQIIALILLYTFPQIGLWLPSVLLREMRRAMMLSAAQAAREIAEGRLTSEELVQACLERIRALEPKVQAWTFLDEEHALAQARAADERKRSGEPIGPLHGVPVGVKDIFDTADMPTENGTVLHRGRMPREDAAAVKSLRAAGAVILGKTVTTECAYFSPGQDAQPAQSRAHARRLLERLGRGRGRRHGAARARQPDQRLGDPAGRVLRRLRLQAHAWPDPAQRGAAALADP